MVFLTGSTNQMLYIGTGGPLQQNRQKWSQKYIKSLKSPFGVENQGWELKYIFTVESR